MNWTTNNAFRGKSRILSHNRRGTNVHCPQMPGDTRSVICARLFLRRQQAICLTQGKQDEDSRFLFLALVKESCLSLQCRWTAKFLGLSLSKFLVVYISLFNIDAQTPCTRLYLYQFFKSSRINICNYATKQKDTARSASAQLVRMAV